MKKTFKKAGVAVLSMAMLLSMGAMAMPASAATTLTSSTITLSGAVGEYKLYQVASADIDANTNAVTYKVNDPFSAVLGTSDDSFYLTAKEADTNAGIAANDKISDMEDHGAKIKAIATKLADAFYNAQNAPAAKGTATISTNTPTPAIDVTEAGYYLILGTASGHTMPILVSVLPNANITTAVTAGNTPVKVKNSEVTFSKKIFAIDAKNSDDDIISADKLSGIVDKGAEVTYILETEIPSYDSKVTALTHHFTITDVPEESLTVKYDSVKVYIDKAKIEENTEALADTNYTVTNDIAVASLNEIYKESAADFVSDVTTDGKGFQIVFKDDYVLNKDNAGKNVKVLFKAVVTSDDTKLDINTNSNDNGATLSYSNNFFTGEGSVTYDRETGKPNEDKDKPKVIPGKAKVYCTAATVNKFKENNEELAGAEFTLYEGGKNKVIGDNGAVLSSAVVVAKPDASGNNKNVFNFNGLGAGTYTLVETKVPDNYYGADPIEFTVTADKASDPDGSYLGNFTFKENNNIVADGVFNVNNLPKQELPGTGGIGTYLFMIGGAAIIMLSGVLFVIYMKKRKEEEE